MNKESGAGNHPYGGINDMKQKRITDLRREKGLDAVLVTNPLNMRYISGCTADTGCLYLSDTSCVFLTDSRYTTQAQEECGGRFTVCEIKGRNGYTDALELYMKQDAVCNIGFEDEVMTWAEARRYQQKLPAKEWIPLQDALDQLRVIKSEEELERVARAESIGDAAFSHILEVLRPGMTELQVAAELEYFMKNAGATKLSFDTIAASGLHSAMPHAVPQDKELADGDFLTMDFGCIYQGYCSDMTRTVVIGKASAKQKEIYQVVLTAQQAALDSIRAGRTGSEIDRIARNIIKDAGYGDYFGHGLGHSLGLFIHEEPRLSALDDTVLCENMLETVEPGIYLPGFGGVRIEDVVVVTKSGCRNLTRSPKELIEIG